MYFITCSISEEGWLTTDDGRHLYIDKDGKASSGKKAIDKAKEEKDTIDKSFESLPIKNKNPSNQEKDKFDKVFEEQYSFSKSDNDIKKTYVEPEDFLKTTYDESKIKGGEFKSYDEYKKVIIDRKSVNRIKTRIESENGKLATPFLEFNVKGIPKGHEGRHTAVALTELGYKSMPVTLVIRRE